MIFFGQAIPRNQIFTWLESNHRLALFTYSPTHFAFWYSTWLIWLWLMKMPTQVVIVVAYIGNATKESVGDSWRLIAWQQLET